MDLSTIAHRMEALVREVHEQDNIHAKVVKELQAVTEDRNRLEEFFDLTHPGWREEWDNWIKSVSDKNYDPIPF